MQIILIKSATELKKAQKKDTSIRLDVSKKIAFTNSVLKQNFNKFNQIVNRGFCYGSRYKIDSLSHRADNNILNLSFLKVCTSCLVMIDVLDNNGYSKVGDIFILDQTPAQMYEMHGQDESQLECLHVYVEQKKSSLKSCIFPSIFLVGLFGTLFYLVYLNAEQLKLIKQKNEVVNHLLHQFQANPSFVRDFYY